MYIIHNHSSVPMLCPGWIRMAHAPLELLLLQACRVHVRLCTTLALTSSSSHLSPVPLTARCLLRLLRLELCSPDNCQPLSRKSVGCHV